MTATEQEYAEQWVADLRVAEMSRERNQQTADRILGVSDIMHCRSYAARFLNGDPFTDAAITHQAMRGTIIHGGILPIIAEARDAREEETVEVRLSNGMTVQGHVDLIDPTLPGVIDLKTVDGLAGVRRHGATSQQRMQRQLYGAGVLQREEWEPPNLQVGNVWMDVNNPLETPHVELEPYDPSWLDTAATWVDDVMYHVDQGRVEDAPKDKDIFWCREFCPFATACRGPEKVAVDEVIESDELAVAAALDSEGKALEKEAKELRKAAAQVLERVQDTKVKVRHSDGREFRVASTWINPSDVAYTRAGYYRRDVREV